MNTVKTYEDIKRQYYLVNNKLAYCFKNKQIKHFRTGTYFFIVTKQIFETLDIQSVSKKESPELFL